MEKAALYTQHPCSDPILKKIHSFCFKDLFQIPFPFVWIKFFSAWGYRENDMKIKSFT
jgi:hypothetical protein